DVYEQELGNVWSLRWSGDGSSLSIEALEDGTIISYWRSDNDDSAVTYYRGATLPKLPKLDAEATKSAAEEFLGRVLDAGTESVELTPAAGVRPNSTSCQFYGQILLNGLPSPLSYSISVRGSDNVVTSFRRDAAANSYLDGVPSPTPAVSVDSAAATLKATLGMELVYVTDSEDENRAVLRYVQTEGGDKYVDAQTGELVDPSGEMGAYGRNAAAPMAEEAMAMDSAKSSLTEAELTGVEKLQGVLDSEALDKLVRTESAYMLDSYTVASANYRVVGEDEDETVLCTLRYALPEDENGFSGSRVFTLDARTGEVKSLYSGAYWNRELKSAVSAEDALKTARAFFSRFSQHADEFDLRSTEDNTENGAPFYGFALARKINGVFFPEDGCTIQIDRMTGAVAAVSMSYSEDKVFDGTEGIVSEAAALDAWMGTFDVTLAYRSQSRELNAAVPVEAKLIDCGYTSFRTLLLTYALEREEYSPGVDAKTGLPVALPTSQYGELSYDDVAGTWAEKEIDTLAACGIGFAGGSFFPRAEMTQWELVALLASTQGMLVDPENATDDERDYAYSTVIRMGALTREERSDDAALTRGELVKLLLRSAGFAEAAQLRGIFTCAYADRGDIPEADLGYAAIAQALGLVQSESYDSGAAVTRAVAAVMLYRLMNRD
ncbi:MAG: S-layer homology domain-containing protein, partial [Oscillospiraceae bacterium]|nr:S-layer homology domain-containing protein [Oscillospiraceae bacterium]